MICFREGIIRWPGERRGIEQHPWKGLAFCFGWYDSLDDQTPPSLSLWIARTERFFPRIALGWCGVWHFPAALIVLNCFYSLLAPLVSKRPEPRSGAELPVLPLQEQWTICSNSGQNMPNILSSWWKGLFSLSSVVLLSQIQLCEAHKIAAALWPWCDQSDVRSTAQMAGDTLAQWDLLT